MIDTHCHLDCEAFFDDIHSVLKDSRENQISAFIIPGADIKDLARAQSLAHTYEDVYFASGVHPYHLSTYDLCSLRAVLKDEKCVAIGECGLDYFRLEGSEEEKRAIKALQEKCFREQIELSLEVNKPLILHVREASGDVVKILRDYPRARGVFHCFNADEILLEFKDRFFYGIGGVLTFKNARRLLEVLPKIPLNRLLLETDSPYLTPHPYRGERNEPRYIPLIVEKISEVLQIAKEKISKQSDQNARELFNL